MHEREWEDGIVGMKMVHPKVAMQIWSLRVYRVAGSKG